jgi:hypothetical protein
MRGISTDDMRTMAALPLNAACRRADNATRRFSRSVHPRNQRFTTMIMKTCARDSA